MIIETVAYWIGYTVGCGIAITFGFWVGYKAMKLYQERTNGSQNQDQ